MSRRSMYSLFPHVIPLHVLPDCSPVRSRGTRASASLRASCAYQNVASRRSPRLLKTPGGNSPVLLAPDWSLARPYSLGRFRGSGCKFYQSVPLRWLSLHLQRLTRSLLLFVNIMINLVSFNL